MDDFFSTTTEIIITTTVVEIYVELIELYRRYSIQQILYKIVQELFVLSIGIRKLM